jgi:hypothetical protein
MICLELQLQLTPLMILKDLSVNASKKDFVNDSNRESGVESADDLE